MNESSPRANRAEKSGDVHAVFKYLMRRTPMKSVSFKQHDAYPEGPVKSNVEPLDSGVKVDDGSRPLTVSIITSSRSTTLRRTSAWVPRTALPAEPSFRQKHRAGKETNFQKNRKQSSTV